MGKYEHEELVYLLRVNAMGLACLKKEEIRRLTMRSKQTITIY